MAKDPVEGFIERWRDASGSELANYQLFLTELCTLLDVPMPDPAREDTRDNAYVFERRVTFRHGDGSESAGRIDLYRRGAFVCEAKKVRKEAGKGFDDAMLRARSQAEQYARALPSSEGRPPFVVVLDVGNVLELYSEFTRSGGTYTPFPDPRSHRIKLTDLRDQGTRERLRQVWLDPIALDPSRRSARVTRDIAAQLAKVARALEVARHDAETVAGFLTRCLFSMFAEDVGLLPKRAFIDLLESLKQNPVQFVPLLSDLWRTMDTGGFAVSIRADVLKFNGKLFRDAIVLPLDRDQIDLLLEAARFNWRDVEPAIFGTLLERALQPDERHKLGAHYTPRSYVERLVLPTVIEPLREDWKTAQSAALVLASEGKMAEAREEIHAFHRALCEVRVLDPACGSGNFLYVTLEHLKRLEGEVFNQLDALGEPQYRLEAHGHTVSPQQLLGIELNPRAAAIAESVLWIGYLQWHFKTTSTNPVPPILQDFHNIEHRDAVLAYDRVEFVTDASGVPITRWDGKTLKRHSVTGEDIPDETARVPVERYINPRLAEWPQVNFVVGNPPFIGNKRMRTLLGDGYVESLRAVWKDVSDSADFVMYWWDRAAEKCRAGAIRQFGLITTNSLRQAFNRRVVERHMGAHPPLSLVFAISDHPWVDSADGAGVRISMSVGGIGPKAGRLAEVSTEREGSDGEIEVELKERVGPIGPDLSVGASVSSAHSLNSNSSLCWQGCKLVGGGFQVSPEQGADLLASDPASAAILRRYWSGSDLTQKREERSVIDTFGLSKEDLRNRFPAAYQWLHDRVLPERSQNRDKGFRERWWLFGRPRPELRSACEGLTRFIATSEVSKHRFFVFLQWPTDLVDGSITAIASSDAGHFGVLSSYPHSAWALAAGGTLEDRPRYQNGPCFDNFPFPLAPRLDRLRELGERLDQHRKRQQAAHPSLTLTGIYNVLDKLRAGEPLSSKERSIHDQGLVTVLKQIHDEIDLAALDAYGWEDLAPLMQVVNGNARPSLDDTAANRDAAKRAIDDVLLERLVALNAQRTAEESRGEIHWLRPDFQIPLASPAPKPRPVQATLDITDAEDTVIGRTSAVSRKPWPSKLPDQVRAVAETLAAASVAIDADAVAAQFTGRGPWKRRLPQLLETLESVGRARRVAGGWLATR